MKQVLEATIEIDRVTKLYAGKIEALSNVTLRIFPGVFGLLGPNGSGKSTLMRIFAGVTKTTGGSVRILGCDLKQQPRHIKQHVGYLPEDSGVYEGMKASTFLQYMGRLAGMSRIDVRARAAQLLDEMGLHGWESIEIAKYSMGMKQRLSFIQAVLHDPRVIFLDEPTNGLDPLERQNVLHKIQEMKAQEKTILLSSHLLVEIEQVADSIGIISKGELLFQGSMRQVEKQGGLARLYRETIIHEDT